MIENIEFFYQDGFEYKKTTMDNGAEITELNYYEEPEPEPEPELVEEYIAKSDLDAAYKEGVNSYAE